MTTESNFDVTEELGRIADRVENLIFALRLRVSDDIHVQGVRANLPEIHADLRAIVARLAE